MYRKSDELFEIEPPIKRTSLVSYAKKNYHHYFLMQVFEKK